MRRTAAILSAAIALCALDLAPARAQELNPPKIADVPSGIAAVLGDYGKAYQAKDRGLLQRVLVPSLAPTELKAFDNAADVPFRVYQVRATTQYSGDLASPRVRAKYPGLQVASYHIIEETALDVEPTPYEEDGAFTFVRARSAPGDPYDGWRLASRTDLDVLAFFSPYHLWNEAPVSVLRSAHFVLLTHPQTADEMRPVLQVAEKGLTRATAFWPMKVTTRFVIIAPSTTEELGRLIHTTIDLFKFVAFMSAGVSQEHGWESAEPRLFVHLAHFRNYNEESRLDIVAHELIHAITRPVTGPHIPAWIEEGLANAGGAKRRPILARSAPPPAEFPTDERFVTGPVKDIVILYDQSQVAVELLIEKFGREGLARFYEKLGSQRVVAGTDPYLVRQAVKDGLGWSVEEWLAAWHKRLG